MLCLSSRIYKRKNNYRYVISQGLFFDFWLDMFVLVKNNKRESEK